MLVYSAVALVITGFRLTVRKSKNWGRDDALAVLATLAFVVQSVILRLRDHKFPRERIRYC